MIVEGIVQQEVDAIGGGSKKKGAAAVVDSARFIKLEFQGGCSVIIRVKDIIDHSDSGKKQV